MNILKSSLLDTRDLENLEIQPIDRGYGPVKIQTYELEMTEGCHEAEKLFHKLLEDINICAPQSLGKYKSPTGNIKLIQDKRLLVHLRGPYNGPIIVEEANESYFRFSTLQYHQEAGFIEFFLDKNRRDAILKIRSTSRAGDKLFNIAFNYLPLGSKIQDAMWVGFLKKFKDIIKKQIDCKTTIQKKSEVIPYKQFHPQAYFLINMSS
ncbi:MAG: hypothetical protein CME62_06110 [Halobacteriovoraceae bacterium]|nr:hypothetical protein [Halobacteriovoraceae bacterium]|tara:strand:+ start:25981 stop:26604 length:624 start_codon:yes stop_codon:yes gene_type:complete